MYSTEMKEDAHFFGMFCQAAKQSRAMLFAAAVLLGLSITAVSAGEKPKPFELGRYIGWLVSCGEIQGSQDEVGRALRRSIERYNSWGYSESDIDTVIKSLRHGIMGRLKWDNGEQICAKLAGNKQSVEWAKQLIERGRYEPGESAKTPTGRRDGSNGPPRKIAWRRRQVSACSALESRLKGGRARAEKLSPEKRREIARKAAKIRWQKK